MDTAIAGNALAAALEGLLLGELAFLLVVISLTLGAANAIFDESTETSRR